MMITSGLYRIVNVRTGRTYIGSSKNVMLRFRYHRWLLNNNRCVNKHLQSSWLKHSEPAFTFELLLECSLDQLMIREQQFIDAYHAHGMPLYNLAPSSKSFVGFETSADVRKSKGRKGRIFSAAHRKGISMANSGRRQSAEVIARTWTPERRAKQSESNRTRIWTTESRARASRATILAMSDPALLARLSVSRRGRRPTPETKLKMSAAQKNAWKIRRLAEL